ncbi:unnamed protein product [Paramecium sonneborni]|uniref:Aconitase A/isopropylmalate dehydratase small subunit swivel domain-containing protein n=1 Tax=Paramecium sonneborni TaxID=65129 RepID=A0A8S1RT87_9CILI|nr:unnamed protein product [Paramecium sonneborni]
MRFKKFYLLQNGILKLIKSIQVIYKLELIRKFINNQEGTERWNQLKVNKTDLYKWKPESTYIHNPPFFQTTELNPKLVQPIKKAYCPLNLAGSIAENSLLVVISKAKVSLRKILILMVPEEEMMKLWLEVHSLTLVGPQTVYVPTGEVMDVFDAADKHMREGNQSIVLAGQEYDSGSSRDWATKGPYLQGVKCVIAQSFERIHRSNLVEMGILPLEFLQGESADTLGLTGKEQFTINVNTSNLTLGQTYTVETSTGKKFQAKSRSDTEVEIEYYKHGGILQYVLRKLVKA